MPLVDRGELNKFPGSNEQKIEVPIGEWKFFNNPGEYLSTGETLSCTIFTLYDNGQGAMFHITPMQAGGEMQHLKPRLQNMFDLFDMNSSSLVISFCANKNKEIQGKSSREKLANYIDSLYPNKTINYWKYGGKKFYLGSDGQLWGDE
jgi:hypothetical protein